MGEAGYITFFLLVWFVIPYVAGTFLFNRLKRKVKWLNGSGKLNKIGGFGVLLLCALVGWMIEMLVLTGIKMML